MRLALLLLMTTACYAAAAPPGASEWVFFGPDHRLHYKTDERGNRIMDFSHAGYGGGGVRIPNVPAAQTLEPTEGDATARIQAAIDAVAALPLGADGFRGAVVLAPGGFELFGSLSINSNGVVLRGSGSGDGGTTIRMRGRSHRFLSIRGEGSWQPEGEPAAIVDAYLPSGADWFTVAPADAARFNPGDQVLIRRPVTEAWVRHMDMDKMVSRTGTGTLTWLRPGNQITFDRTIKSVVGYRVRIDVPLSDSFDAAFLNPPGATLVHYEFPGRISHVGVESLRVDATPEDGGRDYGLIGMSAVSDAWVRDVAVEETQNGVSIGGTARRITLERLRIHHRDTEPHMGGSSPADIVISGSQVLVDRSSVVGKKLWPIVTQAAVTGPNVVLNFSASEAGVSPHQRWATGILVDGGKYRNNWEWRPGVALANRENAGSGHGWSAGWSVCWNVKSDYLLVQQPPGASNWSIGSSARFTSVLWDGRPLPVPCLPSDRIESVGVPVAPASLYLQQLRERLGDAALENIGYDGNFAAIVE